MPTAAISAYGIAVRMGNGTPLANLTLNAATNATPIVVTTTAPHGITDVTVATITGVVGNTAANGTWIVERTGVSTLKLRGSAGNGAYTSGGILAQADTYTTIAELTNLEDAGIMATIVDCTAHDGSLWGSQIPTFLRGNTARLSVNYIPNNPIHGSAMQAAMLGRVLKHWLIVFPDIPRTAWYFQGYVIEDRAQAPVAGVLSAAFRIEMDGAPIVSAA